ncbi:hypothetical protein V2J09_002546 [Rumex salicifolius]
MSVRLVNYQILPLSEYRFHFPSRLRTRISCISGNKSNNNEDDKRKPIRSPKKKRLPMRPTVTAMSDVQLALELAVETEKMKVRAEEGERAMRKSAEMLFDDLCGHLKMKSNTEEVKRRWRRMPEEERRDLVAAFVSDWGVDFQPLSRRGVKQLLDEFVGVDDDDEAIATPNLDSMAAFGMSGLKRLIGFVSG